MWVKINKIVTLVYPQYTAGNLVQERNAVFNLSKDKNFTFEQPFSQVVGGTPVIRLRIGDVIKSNYSRFNISRLFGTGNPAAGASITSSDFLNKQWLENAAWSVSMLPLLGLIASPAEILTISNIQTGIVGITKTILADLLDASLVNGFVNPMLNLTTPATWNDKKKLTQDWSNLNGQVFLKPRFEPYTFVDINDNSKKKSVRILRPTMVKVSTRPPTVASPVGSQIKINVEIDKGFFNLAKSSYQVAGNDDDLENYKSEVSLDQCLIDPDAYFSAYLAGAMTFAQAAGSGLSGALRGGVNAVFSLGADLANDYLASGGLPTNLVDNLQDLFGTYARQYTSPLKNPITHAIEGSMGRGLAGVVTSIQFTWLDQQTTWNIDWNGRAPMACKISMNFDPIHDIGPGLDVYGANRAPVYNVGSMIKIAGDPHADNGRKSQSKYGNSGDELALKALKSG